jgi:hypothetical protein
MLKKFIKNLFYFPKFGVTVTLVWFFVPIGFLFESLGIIETSNPIDLNETLIVNIVFLLIFIVVYGVPVNVIANRSRNKKSKFLEENLGKRLIEEVNLLKNDSQIKEWNNKNKEYLDLIKSIILDRLTKENKSTLEKIKIFNDKIETLEEKIKTEKKLTSEIIKRHPFVKTLKVIQNRTD